MAANKIDAAAADMCCANCGAEDSSLKDCDKKCDLARYCSNKCQQDHLQIHAAVCEERAAELHDEILFRQTESYLGDCPICFLPVSLDPSKRCTSFCCSKTICYGCSHANEVREVRQRLKPKCPFCRTLLPETVDEEGEKERLTKRAEANDPSALCEIGKRHGDKGDYDKAFHYYTRAAELGDAPAHHNLSCLYRDGRGVEKDEEKKVYHLEEAAIAGVPDARYNLGFHEERKGRYDRAVKHWIIGANMGHGGSLQMLKWCYKEGHVVSKDDLAAALRAHQAAVDATKSTQRETAEEFMRQKREKQMSELIMKFAVEESPPSFDLHNLSISRR